MAARNADPALFALSTLPPLLRDAVAESVRRDAEQRMRAGQTLDTSRVSMTAHLRTVLEERGLTSQWRRHFCEARLLRMTSDDTQREVASMSSAPIAVLPSITA